MGIDAGTLIVTIAPAGRRAQRDARIVLWGFQGARYASIYGVTLELDVGDAASPRDVLDALTRALLRRRGNAETRE